MKRNHVVAAFLLLALAVGVSYVAGVNKPQALPEKQEAAVPAPKPATAGKPVPTNEPQSPQVEKAPQPDRTGSMKLKPEAKTEEPVSNSMSFSETMKKEQPREAQLTPGIRINSDREIHMKIPNSAEDVTLRKDDSYHSGEYRMQWEKKF